jgi:hypothetical protein
VRDHGQLVIAQPHAPDGVASQVGPAVEPSLQSCVATRGRGPVQESGPHAGFGGHAVTTQPHVPVTFPSHDGPAVLPSQQISAGLPIAGPHEPGPHVGAGGGGAGGHGVMVQPQVPLVFLSQVGPAVEPPAQRREATSGSGPHSDFVQSFAPPPFRSEDVEESLGGISSVVGALHAATEKPTATTYERMRMLMTKILLAC